jgi:RimJ/RimL family protein N-acetyltransferase
VAGRVDDADRERERLCAGLRPDRRQQLERALEGGMPLRDEAVDATEPTLASFWKDRDVTTTFQPPDPPLGDGVVTLRVPEPRRDAASLRHFDDPAIVRWILGGPPQVTDPVAAIAQREAWHETAAVFSVDAEGHDERVGLIRVMFGLLEPFGFAEIGYIFFPDGRGQGYATRAVRLVAGWVFRLGIGRLQARTSLENVDSERVLERVGFQREGVARSGFVLPLSGERVDTTMWSLLPGELR